eukprot:scaffold1954_cov268-Pinguiococcus_pyrenoidosus.AAC.65
MPPIEFKPADRGQRKIRQRQFGTSLKVGAVQRRALGAGRTCCYSADREARSRRLRLHWLNLVDVRTRPMKSCLKMDSHQSREGNAPPV